MTDYIDINSIVTEANESTHGANADTRWIEAEASPAAMEVPNDLESMFEFEDIEPEKVAMGWRVQNVGLLSTRQNLLIASGFVGIIGALFFLLGKPVERPKQNDGSKELIRAIKEGDLERVQQLVVRGADVNVDENGMSALKLAELYGHDEIAALIRAAILHPERLAN